MVMQDKPTTVWGILRGWSHSAVITRLLVSGMAATTVISLLLMIPALVIGQWLPEGPKIAYMSANDFGGWYNWNIYLLDVDRRLSQQVTNGTQYERYPSWSPDGRFLIYHANQRGSYDLYSIDLINGVPPLDRIQILSPNEFPPVTNFPDQNFDNTPFDAEESPLEPLNDEIDNGRRMFPLSEISQAFNEAMPQWSPDGRYIAYHANNGRGIYNIFLTDRDGADVTQVTYSETGNAIRLMWSPDGKQAVYTVENPVGGMNLYIATVDELLTGSPNNPYPGTPITEENYDENWFPAWSPDGEQIVFVSIRTGDQDLYVIDSTGGTATNITGTLAVEETQPIWTPDGRILFSSNRHGSYDLYIMDADGSNLTRLTFDNDASEEAPAWQPQMN